MNTIAILLTCFNRKAKTINALHAISNAAKKEKVLLSIYLTDDGSSDGTSEAVLEKFPETTILKGNGNLYWAGGMRNSWKEAIKGNYDAYLLLNDDTDVFENVFNQLLFTHKESIKKYNKPGIYIGSTLDKDTKKLSYGGAKLYNRFQFKYNFINPDGTVQNCDLGNANIMLVTKEVVNSIGSLSDGYVHGVADYDYTLKAKKKNIPVLITPEYCGYCTDDHSDIYADFRNKTLKERIKILKSPLGLDFKSNLLLQINHFPIRVPFVIISAMVKTIFPNLYIKNLTNRQQTTNN